jgi:hypothetical protein
VLEGWVGEILRLAAELVQDDHIPG